VSEQNREPTENWERDLIRNLANDALMEKRRARRWGIFFKLLGFAYLGLLLFLAWPGSFDLNQVEGGKDHVALVNLDGEITNLRGADADKVVKGLRNAFKDKHTKAVILRINSPGGLPVQASYMQKEIVRLRTKYPDIPLYAVIADVCASGGYYVASAADRIYVNESSLVGSIGVLMNGFGFTGTMDKLGVQRRLLTAGAHKGFLDPFSPMSEFDKAQAHQMLEEMHQTFIDVVKQGRGDKLADNPELFSGLFWTGKRAIKLGLADAIGSVGSVSRDVVGVEKVVDFTPKDDPLSRIADRIGAKAAATFADILGLGAEPRVR
jgi:protease IV